MAERLFAPLESPCDVVLAGTRLIEAGAGTGKTWTITALVLRLLLEQELEIGQILVVTYTRAATGELRGRIRQRLVEALAAFETGVAGEAFLQELVSRHAASRAQARLRLAIESFDEAAIYTIHGFCQRALAETAFEAGQAFARELVADQQEMLAAVARDAWRRLMVDSSENWVRWLIGQFAGPEGLAKRVRAHLGHVAAQLLAPTVDDRRAVEQVYAAAFAVARQLWQVDKAEICAWIAGAKLHQGSYAPEKMAPRIVLLDRFFSSEVVPFPVPDELVFFGCARITEKCTKASAHPEHEFFIAVDVLLRASGALSSAFESATRRLAHDFLLTARAELSVQKDRKGWQTYDDLLVELAHALRGPSSAALAASLRLRYRAALVDEFQDTDPLQFGVFSDVFGVADHPLVFVGDPKQAIYGFRGADVFAYLAARQQAATGYALLENRRSAPALLVALNVMFARQRPFLLDAMKFEPAIPASMTRQECRIDDAAAPLTLWAMQKPAAASSFSKDVAETLVAGAVANDITRLLLLADAGRAHIGSRVLGGGDIAVLVRKRAQGETIRHALAQRGIASVIMGGGSIWSSAEAEEIERLLLAVAAPAREGLVRAALATVLLGATTVQLAGWAADDGSWSARLDLFHDDLVFCREHGFMAMWRRLLRRERVVPRVLARPDGERRMTNYRHLAELLQAAEHAGTLDAAGLARYIALARQRPEAEETQLRLESDAHLVRIVTIHAAKGLQYPIVYCPFLWDGPKANTDGWPVLAHDRADAGAACLDFGSDRIDVLRRQADLESAAEELRLAYVALTRAEHRCIVAWGKVNQCARAPLSWLLFGPHEVSTSASMDDPRRQLAEKLEMLDESALLDELMELAAGRGDAMRVVPLPESEKVFARADKVFPQTLAPRPFIGTIPAPWRVGSFSLLAARLAEGAVPDRDAIVASPGTVAVLPTPTFGVAPARSAFTSLFDFPRGTRAGSCLHALLERVDFQARANDPALAEFALAEYGFPAAWQSVLVRMLADVVATPLDGTGLSLAQVPCGARLVELEFTFPYASPAGQAGYMKGFIDLVFFHAGRWYIVDYKSNWLGDRAEDYAQPQLAEVMRRHRYDLQLLIYAAALKRALRLREPQLDWANAFGGVFYLFLRGMGPTASTGVYFIRPDDVAINAFLQDGVA